MQGVQDLFVLGMDFLVATRATLTCGEHILKLQPKQETTDEAPNLSSTIAIENRAEPDPMKECHLATRSTKHHSIEKEHGIPHSIGEDDPARYRTVQNTAPHNIEQDHTIQHRTGSHRSPSISNSVPFKERGLCEYKILQQKILPHIGTVPSKKTKHVKQQ